MELILASASPRRKELLNMAGAKFRIVPSDIEEVAKGNTPDEIVVSLAEQKAFSVAEKEGKDALVIGADTIVAIDNEVLGKPKDEDDAFKMLKKLSGREHEVYTGVALFCEGKNINKSFAVLTKVKFYELTDEEIRQYISTGEPLDKAGSYGIQGKGGLFVEKIDGDYNNVVGLPISRLTRELKLYKEFW
ncbi:MAG: Maf family protein [Eubacterium sp.]|nr:Maf family protein [Eubacterium sp.]